ncbi:MAG: HAD-IIB family hydrolase [Candidatus Aenigmarchaeota archaeon]|nr:HAD-IIB family hydrolase [Candidatus Aenigmarchaeota archaeon]MBI5397946.1 HAD-IIB family hydrolase [Candidatus Woesearchaeota archaeon]
MESNIDQSSINRPLKDYRAIVFDLDGTLAPSKSELDAEMRSLLVSLLHSKKVAIISGGSFNQFKKQIIDPFAKVLHSNLSNLLLFPTCGAQQYSYHDSWQRIYALEIPPEEKDRIIKTLDAVIDRLNLRPIEQWGALIEDRGSQITYSALGQQAPLYEKEKWDPDQKKRLAMKQLLDPILPDFEVRIGGATSVDVTMKGIDKAYGIRKIMEALKLSARDIMFVGDALYPGGNDHPALQTGVDAYAVQNPEDTKALIRSIVGDAVEGFI